MNRKERRALEKLEKKGKVLVNDEVSEQGRAWIEYGKSKGIDFNVFFILFSGWLQLPKNDKINVVVDLVSQGLVEPDKDSKKSTESGWKKVDKDGNIVEEEDAEQQDSEGI